MVRCFFPLCSHTGNETMRKAALSYSLLHQSWEAHTGACNQWPLEIYVCCFNKALYLDWDQLLSLFISFTQIWNKPGLFSKIIQFNFIAAYWFPAILKAFVYTDYTLQAPNRVKSTYLYAAIKYLKLRLSSKIPNYKPDARKNKFLKSLRAKELNNCKYKERRQSKTGAPTRHK